MRAILFAALLTLTSSLACSAIPASKSEQKTAPVVQAISPTSASAGVSNITLSVTGQNFNKRANVLWNGKKLLSYMNADGSLNAAVPAVDLATIGTAEVVVENPTGTKSNPVLFTVTAPPSPTSNSSTSTTTTTTVSSLVIATSSLPQGVVSSSYSAVLNASGGTPTYNWSLQAGTFPAGLLLSSTGQIYGIPTQTGTFNFTIRVSDSSSPTNTASKDLSLTVVAAPAPLAITTSSLPSGMAGSVYSAVVTASGGTTPYSFSLASGALPTGLALGTNGTLAGTPTQSGTFSFSVRATDASSQTATKALSLTIAAAAEVGSSPYPQPGDTVVFQDDFESGTLSNWDEKPSRYSIESNAGYVHAGRYSVRGTLNAGYNIGQLNKWYMPGYDEIYVKFHVMFSAGFLDGGMQ
jgi:hypothetical protein